MADYVAKVRSNYFEVKDSNAWQIFCDRHEMTSIMIWDKKRQINLYGFLDNNLGYGVPTSIYDEETEVIQDVDFIDELSSHLTKDEVAIVIEIGSMKMTYIGGYAIAVNSKGDQETVSLQDIMELANTLGKNITSPED